ncbi:uncharacterized protein LOC124284184 [Haliotis rubra]|uniref:uncharacterized protein LOC124284184 n=1 Tax=Haliotis rubra TaxID=36100 RepID=UPI001EE53E81|nr:uncharacterized protein LOC124284184 [Haliotis rubra]
MAGSQQRPGLSVNTHQKTADRLRDDHRVESPRHPKDSTMALEIPSLNSADLNNIVFKLFKYPTCGQQFRSPMTTSIVVDSSDTELSPEPRTPQFSSSAGPTFRESNRNFGFTFPIPAAQPPRGLTTNDAKITPSVSKTDQSPLPQATTVTNGHLHGSTYVLEGQSQADVGTEANVQFPVQLGTRSAESPVGLQTFLLTSSAVKEPSPEPSYPTNIPTTVLESAQLSNGRYPQPNPQDMPKVLVRGEDGKTTSFIRFLNDPIPLPNEMEYKLLNIEGYRPSEESVQHETDAPIDNKVIADINAIQRMEEEPVLPGEASEIDPATYQTVQYIQYEADTNVNRQVVYVELPNCQVVGVDSHEVQDQTQVNEQLMYEEIPNDCQEAMEVAAYQSVDEAQNASDVLTYTELTPRTQPPPPDHTQQEDLQEQDEESQESKEALTQRFGEKYHNASDEAKRAFASAVKENSMRPLLKMELKHKIQLKRLQEGKGELKVTFEDRPIGEPTEEEKVKSNTRKQKNRESAVRSRKKREEHLKILEKTVKELDRENKELSREIVQLRTSIADDLQQVACIGCNCFTTNTNAADVVAARDASTKSLQEAIRDVLASEQYKYT